MSEPGPEPTSRAGGGKLLGMNKTTWYIVAAAAVAGAAWYLYQKHKSGGAKAAAPNAQAGMSGECTDANGNPTPCVDMAGVDYAGQLSAIQTELESIAAGQGTAAAPAPAAPAAPAAPPAAAAPGQVTQYPSVGFTARKLNANTIQVSFSALTSPAPVPGSYTIEAWQLNGKVAAQQTMTAPDTTGGKGVATINGLHTGWCYNVKVWANGGKVAPSGQPQKVCL